MSCQVWPILAKSKCFHNIPSYNWNTGSLCGNHCLRDSCDIFHQKSTRSVSFQNIISSCKQYSRHWSHLTRLSYPSFLIIFTTCNMFTQGNHKQVCHNSQYEFLYLIAAILIIISAIDRGSLYCSAPDVISSFDHPTVYAVISGQVKMLKYSTSINMFLIMLPYLQDLSTITYWWIWWLCGSVIYYSFLPNFYFQSNLTMPLKRDYTNTLVYL